MHWTGESAFEVSAGPAFFPRAGPATTSFEDYRLGLRNRRAARASPVPSRRIDAGSGTAVCTGGWEVKLVSEIVARILAPLNSPPGSPPNNRFSHTKNPYWPTRFETDRRQSSRLTDHPR